MAAAVTTTMTTTTTTTAMTTTTNVSTATSATKMIHPFFPNRDRNEGKLQTTNIRTSTSVMTCWKEYLHGLSRDDVMILWDNWQSIYDILQERVSLDGGIQQYDHLHEQQQQEKQQQPTQHQDQERFSPSPLPLPCSPIPSGAEQMVEGKISIGVVTPTENDDKRRNGQRNVIKLNQRERNIRHRQQQKQDEEGPALYDCPFPPEVLRLLIPFLNIYDLGRFLLLSSKGIRQILAVDEYGDDYVWKELCLSKWSNKLSEDVIIDECETTSSDSTTPTSSNFLSSSHNINNVKSIIPSNNRNQNEQQQQYFYLQSQSSRRRRHHRCRPGCLVDYYQQGNNNSEHQQSKQDQSTTSSSSSSSSSKQIMTYRQYFLARHQPIRLALDEESLSPLEPPRTIRQAQDYTLVLDVWNGQGQLIIPSLIISSTTKRSSTISSSSLLNIIDNMDDEEDEESSTGSPPLLLEELFTKGTITLDLPLPAKVGTLPRSRAQCYNLPERYKKWQARLDLFVDHETNLQHGNQQQQDQQQAGLEKSDTSTGTAPQAALWEKNQKNGGRQLRRRQQKHHVLLDSQFAWWRGWSQHGELTFRQRERSKGLEVTDRGATLQHRILRATVPVRRTTASTRYSTNLRNHRRAAAAPSSSSGGGMVTTATASAWAGYLGLQFKVVLICEEVDYQLEEKQQQREQEQYGRERATTDADIRTRLRRRRAERGRGQQQQSDNETTGHDTTTTTENSNDDNVIFAFTKVRIEAIRLHENAYGNIQHMIFRKDEGWQKHGVELLHLIEELR